jgi:hypothetical protein
LEDGSQIEDGTFEKCRVAFTSTMTLLAMFPKVPLLKTAV